MYLSILIGLLACSETNKGGTTLIVEEVARDNDGDGYSSDDDCDDSNSTINPSADEICDGVDNNCNGEADEGVKTDFFVDSDGDGYGNMEIITQACQAPTGFVSNGSDCDDANENSYPSAEEICDDVDNNCNGEIDENLAQTFYKDSDFDGIGDTSQPIQACSLTSGLSAIGGDCDDTDPSVSPVIAESCDGLDNNCDGQIDEGTTQTFYADTDDDGYGNPNEPMEACGIISGYSQNTLDCDDTDTLINPAADEYCDDIDNDCDGIVDDDYAVDAMVFYEDGDGDGYGNVANYAWACTAPSNHVANAQDCDDSNSLIFPGAAEFCNLVDDDCDSLIDEEDSTGSFVWYADYDNDGYGDIATQVTSCDQPEEYVTSAGDCDDNDNDIFPGAVEYCDGEDNDCDGTVDGANAQDITTWYLDMDDDGFGVDTDVVEECDAPSGYVAVAEDCDDDDATINPDADEIWYDDVDQNCDEASDFDQDGDGVDSIDYGGDDCLDTDPTEQAGCSLYDFSSHAFTSCGSTGQYGPTLAACRSAYSTSDNWHEDDSFLNMTTAGIQSWTVPVSGTYRIVAQGAAGASNSQSYSRAYGASMQGDFELEEGEVILILVGQAGTGNNTHGNENGGGGGSFVVRNSLTPLLVAGGAGGAPSLSYSSNCGKSDGSGRLSTTGGSVSCYTNASGGSSGYGGGTGGSYQGGGGAGFYGDGSNGTAHCGTPTGGSSFVSGGIGGTGNSCYSTAEGGFGGGGAGGLGAPGGGGGYSGGASAGYWSTYADYGGGGGSYNSGTNQVNQVMGSGTGYGPNGFDGVVIITLQ